MLPDPRLPRWAPRVSQSLIRRLYETDAKGTYEEDPLTVVGAVPVARSARKMGG